jgi:hypothetical protein
MFAMASVIEAKGLRLGVVRIFGYYNAPEGQVCRGVLPVLGRIFLFARGLVLLFHDNVWSFARLM